MKPSLLTSKLCETAEDGSNLCTVPSHSQKIYHYNKRRMHLGTNWGHELIKSTPKLRACINRTSLSSRNSVFHSSGVKNTLPSPPVGTILLAMCTSCRGGSLAPTSPGKTSPLKLTNWALHRALCVPVPLKCQSFQGKLLVSKPSSFFQSSSGLPLGKTFLDFTSNHFVRPADRSSLVILGEYPALRLNPCNRPTRQLFVGTTFTRMNPAGTRHESTSSASCIASTNNFAPHPSSKNAYY